MTTSVLPPAIVLVLAQKSSTGMTDQTHNLGSDQGLVSALGNDIERLIALHQSPVFHIAAVVATQRSKR